MDPVVITVELSIVGPFLARTEESVRIWFQLVSRDLVSRQDTVLGGEQQSMAYNTLILIFVNFRQCSNL